MVLNWLVPIIFLVLGESIMMAASSSTLSPNATFLPLDSVEEGIPPRRHPLVSLEPIQAKSIFADATRNPLRRTTLAPATNAPSFPPSPRRARSPTPELSVSFETYRILDDIDRAGDVGENLLPPVSQQVLFQPSADTHDPQKQLLEKPDKSITTTTAPTTTAFTTTTRTTTTTTTTSTRASTTPATVLPIEVAPATIATNIVDGEVVKYTRVQWNFIDPAVQFLKRLRSRTRVGKVRTKRDKFALDGQPIIRSGSTNSGRVVSSEEREVVEREQLSVLPKLVPLTTTTTTTMAPTSPKPKSKKKKVARPSRPVPAKKKGSGRRPAALVVAVPAKKKEIVPDGRQRVTVTGGDFRQDLPPTNAANDKNIEESFNPSAGLKPTDSVAKKTPSPPAIAPPSPRPRPTPPTPSTLQPDRFVVIGGRRFILRTIPSGQQPSQQQPQFPQQQQQSPQFIPQLQQLPPQPFFPQWQSPPQQPLFPPQPQPQQPSLPQQFFVPPQQQPFVPAVPPRLLPPPPRRVQVVTPRQPPAASKNRALIPTSTEPTTLSPEVEEETLVPLHELITTTRGSIASHLKVWNGDFYDEVGGNGWDEPPPPSDPAQHAGSVRRSRKDDTNVGDAGTGAVAIETSGHPVRATLRKTRSAPQPTSASVDSDDDVIIEE